MSRTADEPTLPPANLNETAAPVVSRTDLVVAEATLPPAVDPDTTIAPDTTAQRTPVDARAPAGYVIEGELGRGGMGVVYLARHLGLDRPCALKMILSGAHANAAEADRFRTEAQAIARLQHPGIVQVFEIGEHDGRPFMALEFCAGGSLHDKLADNPLPPREAAELVRALAEAMQAAHQARVIHRDLKPANILLTETGVPKITDFGLAKKLDEAGATRTGHVMGTPSYMPPEQAEGKKEVGPAADIYALGAILYECLTGRPPFRAATALDTLLQVVLDEAVGVRQLNAKVPVDLETIVHKCLQKDPGKRYATAQELADDLDRFLNGEPVRARPVGAVEKAVKWVRRNPVVAALATAVFLVLVAGVAVSAYFAVEANSRAEEAKAVAKRARDAADGEVKQRTIAEGKTAEAKAEAKRANDNKNRADDEAKEAKKQTGIAQWNERLAKDSAHAIKLDLAWRAREQSDWERMRQLLEETHPDYGQTLENRLVKALWVKQAFPLKNLVGHTGAVFSVSFSPDGQHILTASLDKTARVWDAQTGTEKFALKGHTGKVTSVCFSPDGKRIATGSEDKTARVWDAQTGQP